MKFVLFVEGQTEQKGIKEFIKKWLDSRISQSVGLQLVRFKGFGEFKTSLEKKAAMYLAKDDVIAVISLLDLYGVSSDFYPSNKRNASERYEWGKRYFEEKVNHPNYRHFFAVHETEAWLFGDLDNLPRNLRNNLPSSIQTPEKIDFDNPPSKLMGNLYRKSFNRKYNKPVHGKKLFSQMNPEIACQKCPRFKEFLDALLNMARVAGL